MYKYKPKVYRLAYWFGLKQHDEGCIRTRKIIVFPDEIMKIVNKPHDFVSFVDYYGLKFIIRQENIIEIQETGE